MNRKIKINLANKSTITVIFVVNDHEEKVSSGFDINIEVEKVTYVGVRPAKIGEAEGDFWIYEVTEDTRFECSKYGSELKLHY